MGQNKKFKKRVLEENKKFQKRKFAYFSPTVRGRGVYKPLFIFVQVLPLGPFLIDLKLKFEFLKKILQKTHFSKL